MRALDGRSKMSKQSKLREAAEQLQVYELVALKRWLRGHGGFDPGINQRYHNRDIKYLMALVRNRGGDPELIKARGREHGIEVICKYRGYD